MINNRPLRPQPRPLSVEHHVAKQDNTRVVLPLSVANIGSAIEDFTDIAGGAIQSSLSSLGFVNKEISAKDLITNLASEKLFIGGRIRQSTSKELEAEIQKMLSDKDTRKSLINYFDLDSAANRSDLASATGLEAGYQDYKEIFPVGATILNRALATNVIRSARQFQSKGETALDNYQPISIRDVIMENSQFAISKSRFRTVSTWHQQDPNRADRHANFTLNNQVIDDLYAGQSSFKDWDNNSVDASELYFFHKAGFPSTKLKTPNGHRFATHQTKKEVYYPIFNSFNMSRINYNK